MSDYNGWKNWETWNLNLWLSNDEPLYEVARCLARRSFDDLEDFGTRVVWESLGLDPDTNLAGPGPDFVRASLTQVDWRELREALLE